MLKLYASIGGTKMPTNRAFFIIPVGNPGWVLHVSNVAQTMCEVLCGSPFGHCYFPPMGKRLKHHEQISHPVSAIIFASASSSIFMIGGVSRFLRSNAAWKPSSTKRFAHKPYSTILTSLQCALSGISSNASNICA